MGIDTMPVLAWSVKQVQSFRELQADGKDSAFVKFMISNQKYFYFPILLLARLSWLNESFKYAFGVGAASENATLERETKGLQYPFLEKILHLVTNNAKINTQCAIHCQRFDCQMLCET